MSPTEGQIPGSPTELAAEDEVTQVEKERAVAKNIAHYTSGSQTSSIPGRARPGFNEQDGLLSESLRNSAVHEVPNKSIAHYDSIRLVAPLQLQRETREDSINKMGSVSESVRNPPVDKEGETSEDSVNTMGSLAESVRSSLEGGLSL